jgi:ArsR family metal-binding transcriptional regulator
MTAQHIGRLTLSRQENVDLYAEHMDRETDKVNKMWISRKSLPDPQQERQRRKLQEIWERLHFTMPECDCAQCLRGPRPLKKGTGKPSM